MVKKKRERNVIDRGWTEDNVLIPTTDREGKRWTKIKVYEIEVEATQYKSFYVSIYPMEYIDKSMKGWNYNIMSMAIFSPPSSVYDYYGYTGKYFKTFEEAKEKALKKAKTMSFPRYYTELGNWKEKKPKKSFCPNVKIEIWNSNLEDPITEKYLLKPYVYFKGPKKEKIDLNIDVTIKRDEESKGKWIFLFDVIGVIRNGVYRERYNSRSHGHTYKTAEEAKKAFFKLYEPFLKENGYILDEKTLHEIKEQGLLNKKLKGCTYTED